MAIYYEAYVHDQIKEYINGREFVKSLCDFTIVNFNWRVTAAIMDTRIGFFYFEETSPGLIRIMDYGELGLQDISKIEKDNTGKIFKCSLHTRDGRLALESVHKEDADQFVDLLSKVSEGASGFQRWILDLNKHGMDLSSFIFWSTTGRMQSEPVTAKKTMTIIQISGFGGIALFLLGMIFNLGIPVLIGSVMAIYGGYRYYKGRNRKCPSCGTFNGLKHIDKRLVSDDASAQTYNLYRYCLNCGLKVIGSLTIPKPSR